MNGSYDKLVSSSCTSHPSPKEKPFLPFIYIIIKVYVIIKVCCKWNVNLVKILLSNRIRVLTLYSVLIVVCK